MARMPALVRSTLITIAAAVTVLSTGCGNEIGDSCSLHSECSTTGERICDLSSPSGYCTIVGCDYDTCPDEAVCVSFFSVAATNLPCTTSDDCTSDEICTLGGYCVPRSSEVRYCMKKCGNDGDCRDKYECRRLDLMQQHGGEPVPPPGEQLDPDDLQGFCAAAPLD